MSLDLAITEVDGKLTLHQATCSHARTMAFLGYPVATLFECQRMPEDIPRHSCLDQAPRQPQPESPYIR